MSEEKIVYFVQRRVENLRNHPGMVFYIGHQVPGPIRALTHQRETSFLRASAISSAGSDGMNVGTPSSANPALIPSDNRPPLRNVNTENLRQASVKEEELKSAEFKMEEQKENVEGTSVGMCSRFKRRLSCSSDESSICSQETVQVKTDSPDIYSQEILECHRTNLEDEDTASVTDSDDERGETKEISVGELSIDDEQEESLRVASESPKESTRISLSSLSMRRKESDVLQSEDRDQLEEANTHWVDALESLDRINLLLGNVTPETGKENAKTDSPSDVTEKSGNKQGDRSLPFVVGPNCDISINKPETVTEESSIILSSDHIHDSSHSIERTETQLSESVLIPTTVLTSTNATSEKAPCGEPANDIPRAEDFTSPVLAASNLPDQEEGEAESGPVLPNETNSSLEMIDESDKGKCNDDSGILDSENLVPDPVPDSVAERMNDDRGSDESSGTMTAREDGKENISDEVVCIAEAETVASNKQSNAEAAENGNKDVRKEALTEVEIADALNVIADLVEKISNSIDANPVETGDDQKTSKSTDPENDSLESPEVELAQCVVLSETVPDGLEDTAGKTSDQFLETTTVEKDVLDGKSNESAPKKDEVASESPAGSSKTSFDSGREKSTPRKNAPSVGRVVAKKASVLLVDTIPIEADRKKQSGVDKVSESTERIRGFSVRQSVADTKHSSLKKTKPASLEIDEKRTQPKEDLQRNPVQRPRSRDDSDSSLKRKSIKERRRRTYDGRKTVDTHKSAERSVTDQSSIRKHHTSRDGDADKELQKHTSGQERKRGSISSDEKSESSVSNASDVESNKPSSSSTGGCEVSETKITDSTEVLDQTLQGQPGRSPGVRQKKKLTSGNRRKTYSDLDSRRRKKEKRKSSKNSTSSVSRLRDSSPFSQDDSSGERSECSRRRQYSYDYQDSDHGEYSTYEEYWHDRYRKESERLRPYWEKLGQIENDDFGQVCSSQTIEFHHECRRSARKESVSFSTHRWFSTTRSLEREEGWSRIHPSAPLGNKEGGQGSTDPTSPPQRQERRRSSSSTITDDPERLLVTVNRSSREPEKSRRTCSINLSHRRGSREERRGTDKCESRSLVGRETIAKSGCGISSVRSEATASSSKTPPQSQLVSQESYTEEQERLRQKFIDRILESWPKDV